MVFPGCWQRYDRFRQLKIMTVEPVIFLYVFASTLMSFIFQMYAINQHQTETLVAAVSKNSSHAHCRDLAYPNRSFVCITIQDLSNCTNSSASYDGVEERTSTLILVTNVAGQILSILVALFCGPISDRVGRKPMMLALSVSGTLSAGIVLVIMYLKLDVYFFILASFVSSLGGGTPVLITTCFSYITDISSGKWLTYRIGIAEGMLFLSAGLCTTIAGVWLNRSNCFYPYVIWLVLSAFLAIGVYVVLYLPESLSRGERLRRRALTSNQPVGWRTILRGLSIVFLPGHSRWRLWLLVYMLGVIYFIASGLGAVSNLYLTHPPLQWGAELIGYYDLMFSILHGFALIFLLPTLVALTLHDSVISFVGMLFCASMAVLNIFVKTTWQMFTIGVIMSIEGISAPPMRSMVSNSVDRSDQGAIFSVVAAVQSITSVLATVAFSLSYSRILKAGWPAGTVFSLTAFVAASTLPLSIVLFLFRNKKGAKYEPPVTKEGRSLLNAESA